MSITNIIKNLNLPKNNLRTRIHKQPFDKF